MFFSLVKEINRLISKGMSNIFYHWEKLTFSKRRFSTFQKFVSGSILRSSNSRRYHWILIMLVATGKSDVWEQDCVCLFYYCNFERNYDVSKWKSPCVLLNRNINFNESKTESKMGNPTHSFRETNLVLQLI